MPTKGLALRGFMEHLLLRQQNKTTAYRGFAAMLADLHILIFLFAISFCPGLTFTILLHNKFCTLVFQSASVAGRT